MKFRSLLCLLSLSILAACGGGDSAPSPAPTTIYYVSSSAADDSGDGLTPATAKRNIHAALNTAMLPAEIRVNGGSYNVDSTAGTNTHIVFRNGVTLRGGYSADFSSRNPALNTSTITDTGTGMGIHAAMTDQGMAVNAVVDGFTINASATAETTIAVYLSSSFSNLVINNCIIDGGAGSSQSAGISLAGATALISSNTINGGTGVVSTRGVYASNSVVTLTNNQVDGGDGTPIWSRGIHLSSSTATLTGNEIDGGNAANFSTGVESLSSTTTLSTNTINGGNSGSDSYGIQTYDDSTALITNNIISGGTSNATKSIRSGDGAAVTSNSTTVRNNILLAGQGANDADGVENLVGVFILENNILYGNNVIGSPAIDEGFAGGVFTSINNNDIYGFDRVYYDLDGNCISNLDGDNNAFTCNLAEMETLGTIPNGASNNVEANPLFADIDGLDNDINTLFDNDLHFSAGSPASVTAGGLNGLDQMPVWSFSSDKDGMPRPASGNPWSMGAYAAINIRPFDHTPVAGLACASAGCHNGASPATYKPITHPVTTNTCESCHTTLSWTPLLIPIDHSQTTDACSTCHNNVIATGKPGNHIPTMLECDNCHTTAGWLPATPP